MFKTTLKNPTKLINLINRTSLGPRYTNILSPYYLKINRGYTTQPNQLPTDSKIEKKQDKLTLKELIKKYGLAAFIVYNGISLIDLSITFSILHFGGEEQVLYLQSKVSELVSYFKTTPTEVMQQLPEKPSLWTTFAVAYSIHKLLVPIRVPITAMLTPNFAKTLQKLGWIKKVN